MESMQAYQLIEEIIPRDNFLSQLGKLPTCRKPKSKKFYLNVSASFDIETSSFYYCRETGETTGKKPNISKLQFKKEYERHACMYAWVFTLNGRATTGRTWLEFIQLINELRAFYELGDNMILPIYVHNLSYEFQFIRNLFHVTDVFALAPREPLYCRTSEGLEFRCSMKLSGYSLATTAKNLKKFNLSKKIGDLDYGLMRNSKTLLTKEEWGYILYDGLIVSAYIKEQIDEWKNVINIPMTKTGVVRRYLRESCYYESKNHRKNKTHKYQKYRTLMNRLTLEVDEYKLANRCIQGGIVHCSAVNEGRVYQDVDSKDFTSSYPYCIVAFKYPMSKGERFTPKNLKEFNDILECRLAIFDIEFEGVESRQLFEHVLSSSKCWKIENAIIDNGRVVSADTIRTSMTSIDYLYFKKFYQWKKMKIGLMYVYKAGYLPTDFVKAVIKLYKDKTTLKDVDDELSKQRYAWSKEQLNSCYGCLIMNICRVTYKYEDGKWVTEKEDTEKQIKEYNEDPKRFSSYLWGVFIPSYARYNLTTAIIECGKSFDYIYSDTDSVKIKNADKHAEYFKRYNEGVVRRLKRACRYHGVSYEDVAPKTIQGKTKILGVWDDEYHAKRFKALRAKCYMMEDENGNFHLTIAGVNKKIAEPRLIELARKKKKDIFDLIKWGFVFDEKTCGKNLHTYVDERATGMLRDYKGVESVYDELSFVHLEPTTYKMCSSEEYLNFLDNIQSKEGGIN